MAVIICKKKVFTAVVKKNAVLSWSHKAGDKENALNSLCKKTYFCDIEGIGIL